jgi:hypothetical protein
MPYLASRRSSRDFKVGDFDTAASNRPRDKTLCRIPEINGVDIVESICDH